jgi:hypothetical protein
VGVIRVGRWIEIDLLRSITNAFASFLEKKNMTKPEFSTKPTIGKGPFSSFMGITGLDSNLHVSILHHILWTI